MIVGLVANPMSGRDVRRVAARAARQTPESKRNQIQRALVGAVAGGARRILLMRDCFRIAESAAESLRLDAEIEFVGGPIETRDIDTRRAVAAMREAGARCLIGMGGDGTQRVIAASWRDAPLIPLSTGTNNVYPQMLEATAAGAAAGLVASGAVEVERVARASKCIEIEGPDGRNDLALIDAALLAGDHPGNLMPFEPALLRSLLLARAEPAAVGLSALGGLLLPSGADDDHGVLLRCGCAHDGYPGLLAPIAPGLYREAWVGDAQRVPLGIWQRFEGPGLLALDGDRQSGIAADESLRLRVVRAGPRVIDVPTALREAARLGVFRGRGAPEGLDLRFAAPSCC